MGRQTLRDTESECVMPVPLPRIKIACNGLLDRLVASDAAGIAAKTRVGLNIVMTSLSWHCCWRQSIGAIAGYGIRPKNQSQ